MEVIERPDVAFKLLEMAKANRPPRAKGYHATDHLHCLRKSVWEYVTDRPLLDAESSLHPDSAYRTQLLFLRGEGIGNFFEEGKPEYRFPSPDGFGVCSVDRLWEADGETFIMELKTTRMSAGYSLLKEDSATQGYVVQVVTYLTKHMVKEGIPFDPSKQYKCFIYVFYDMGDYTGNDRRPDHRAFELRLWGHELSAWNEELMRRHALLVKSMQTFDNVRAATQYDKEQLDRMTDLLPVHLDLEALLPPVGEHWSYECEQYSRCPIKDLIDCPGTAGNAKWKMPFQIEKEVYAREHRVAKGKKK